MSDRLTRNSWEGGLNTDTDKSKLDPIYYTEAHNLDSVSDGAFSALTNIRGTTKVKALVNPPNTVVLGVFANKYLIEDVYKQCLTIFTAGESFTPSNPDVFKVWCYDTEENNIYELFEENIEDDYLTDNRVIDAFGYAENNIDHIYFTDDYNEIRYLRCEIPSPYVANFLSVADLSLQRLGAAGAVVLNNGTVLTGGSLLSGSYQFAYRMVDPINKRFSKWSSLSHPIHIYSAANSSGTVFADYGLPTNFRILVDVEIPQAELDTYDYFQVAVVENIYPTGPEKIVDGENQTFVASLLPIESTASSQNYIFKTNAKIGTIPIEDIVVDLAAIKNVKSINVKEKTLVGGNVEYHNLEFDNGIPVASGSILTHTSTTGDLFSSHAESIFKGHFRDEVYRYGIVYKDRFGNRSPVKVLDLSAITNNQISGAGTIPDVRFPSRSTSNSWSLFDTNSSPSRLRSLGLHLTSIHNHPTWAVGFEIVRAKRIKKILTQTPIVPMVYTQGIGAIDGYPSLAVTVANGDPDNEYPDAQPQTTSKIYMPKNFFWPESRGIKRTAFPVSSGLSNVKKGEAELTRIGDVSLAMIFPQNFMYDDGVFTLVGSEKLQTVDYCALRVSLTDYNVGISAGDALETRIKGTFYALSSGDYYFDPAWAGKSITDTDTSITGYLTFKNLGEPSSLNGKSVMDYAALSTQGVSIGFEPKIQKSVIIDATGSSNHDLMAGASKVFASAGTMNTAADGVAIFSSTPTLVFQNAVGITNKYINEYANFSNNSSYVQAVKIVNIVNNYSDDRYGDVDFQHEFISTGAAYYFTPSELINVQAGTLVNSTVDVWGGDCFVSPHTFKITDGGYSVVNQTKHNIPRVADSSSNLISKWTKYFLNTGGAAIAMPVGIEGAAQFITVILESEYNGGVMAQDILGSSGVSVNNIPILTPDGGEEALRSPLTYRYNLNLSKQNDEKVYFTKPEFNFEKSSFPARVVFTDQKIYNTDNVGFDIFRVLNFRDLEEKNGEITKLAVEGDNLYAIQEKGIVNLPVGETQATLTDAGQLAIGISDFFGRPIVIDDKRGSQHIKSIVETGDAIYIPDYANKSVYLLRGNQIQTISHLNNASLFRTKFSDTATERNLVGIYDTLRKQYWLANENYCYLFNEEKKQWVTNLEFAAGALRGGVFMNQNLFLMGMEGDQVNVYTMYTGSAGLLFDIVAVPRVSFYVNPDDPITKVFTNQAYISTEKLDIADFTVEREQDLVDQTIVGTNIAVYPVGGKYPIKLPRAAGNERLRGLRMLTTVKWSPERFNTYPTLSEVLTKYRHESRTPF